MVYVVNEVTQEVLFKVDAWTIGAESIACKWAKDNGYSYIRDYITMSGNMVILVR